MSTSIPCSHAQVRFSMPIPHRVPPAWAFCCTAAHSDEISTPLKHPRLYSRSVQQHRTKMKCCLRDYAVQRINIQVQSAALQKHAPWEHQPNGSVQPNGCTWSCCSDITPYCCEYYSSHILPTAPFSPKILFFFPNPRWGGAGLPQPAPKTELVMGEMGVGVGVAVKNVAIYVRVCVCALHT